MSWGPGAHRVPQYSWFFNRRFYREIFKWSSSEHGSQVIFSLFSSRGLRVRGPLGSIVYCSWFSGFFSFSKKGFDALKFEKKKINFCLTQTKCLSTSFAMLFRFSASRSIAIFLDFLDEYRTVNVKRDKEEIPVECVSKAARILGFSVNPLATHTLERQGTREHRAIWYDHARWHHRTVHPPCRAPKLHVVSQTSNTRIPSTLNLSSSSRRCWYATMSESARRWPHPLIKGETWQVWRKHARSAAWGVR